MMYGLIAQDLEESLTEVGIEKNSTWLLQHEPKNDEKQSDYSLDYLKLTPVLIKAIQEQQTLIETLQAKVEALETSSPSAPLTVSTTGSGDAVIIESTEAGSSNAPDLVLHRNSASPADDDSLGIIRFRGENDASEAIDLINIFGQVTDVSDGSEDSTLYFKTYTDGAEQSPLTLVGANVGIGTTSPIAQLELVMGVCLDLQ
jgi:hypothetical protein